MEYKRSNKSKKTENFYQNFVNSNHQTRESHHEYLRIVVYAFKTLQKLQDERTNEYNVPKTNVIPKKESGASSYVDEDDCRQEETPKTPL